MKKKGFTLIELLVVIVIMGIVLVLVIPNVTSLISKGNSQKYEKLEKVAVEAGKLYAISYQGELDNTNGTCWTIPYQTLINEGLIQEEDIKCEGYVVLTKREKNGYDYDSILTCKDKKGNIVHETTGKTLNPMCRGFSGKFNASYELYTDSSLTTSYDPGSNSNKNWVKNVYAKYESVSPYGFEIERYEYSYDFLNWHPMVDENSFNTNIQKYTDFDGIVIFRAVDTAQNVSSESKHYVFADSFTPTLDKKEDRIIINDLYNFKNNLKEEKFGPSGGEIICTPPTSNGYDQVAGLEVTCTAKGNTGMNKTVKYLADIDMKKPIISNKNDNIIVNRVDYDFRDNITAQFGVLNGVITCTPSTASGYDGKTISVTCKATGNNGLESTTTFNAKVDATVPIIELKKAGIDLTEEKIDFVDNLVVTYGPTGGTVSCTPSDNTNFKAAFDVTCTAVGTNGLISSKTFRYYGCESLLNKVYTYDYTGDKQEFVAYCPGTYKLDAYGAGSTGGGTRTEIYGGSGGHASGNVYLDENRKLYVYVGGYINGYNGGGNGTITDATEKVCLTATNCSTGKENCPCITYAPYNYLSSSKGSGATDFRIIPASDGTWYDTNHESWNTDVSLLSRIVTAGGGGGANANKNRQFSGAYGQTYFGNTSAYNNVSYGPLSNGQLGLGSDGMQGSLAMIENNDGRVYHDQGYTASGGGGGGWYGGSSVTYTVNKQTVLASGGKSYTYDSLFGINNLNCGPLPGYGSLFSCNTNDEKNNYAGVYARVNAIVNYYHVSHINMNRFIGADIRTYQGTNHVQSYTGSDFTYNVTNPVSEDLVYTDGPGLAKITYISTK